MPFLCTSTYRTGDNIYTHKIINEHKMKVINKIIHIAIDNNCGRFKC